MSQFRLKVNGTSHGVETEGERPLLEVLREDLELTGVKYGCGEGQCRACTVLLDGRPALSCVTPVRAAAGKEIVTIEGLATGSSLHPVQQAFLDAGAMQCGYCVPGMILTAAALLQRTPHPSEAQVVDALNGNMCRCCAYPRILDAVRRAAGVASPAPGVTRAGRE